MKNFWSSFAKATEDKLKLNEAIFALAPMAGVADSAFRQICVSFGADVVYSEMVSATALVYNSKKTLELMKFSKLERPYVVQLFGSRPEHFALAAKVVEKKIKPQGIDINFGCPVKKILKQGAGGALMQNLKQAREVIKATVDNTTLPVSIKIRSASGEITAIDFLKKMADLDIKAVMIHGRSLKQGNSGEVDWKIIKQARPLVKGVLIANGGVKDRVGAEKLLKLTGADGLGIGQAALGKPWIFEDLKSTQPSLLKGEEEIFKVMLKHAKLARKLKDKEGILEMRKHLCWYVNGLKNASELRRDLVKVNNLEEIKKILLI